MPSAVPDDGEAASRADVPTPGRAGRHRRAASGSSTRMIPAARQAASTAAASLTSAPVCERAARAPASLAAGGEEHDRLAGLRGDLREGAAVAEVLAVERRPHEFRRARRTTRAGRPPPDRPGSRSTQSARNRGRRRRPGARSRARGCHSARSGRSRRAGTRWRRGRAPRPRRTRRGSSGRGASPRRRVRARPPHARARRRPPRVSPRPALIATIASRADGQRLRRRPLRTPPQAPPRRRARAAREGRPPTGRRGVPVPPAQCG